jgi:hypothetical protein
VTEGRAVEEPGRVAAAHAAAARLHSCVCPG